LFFEGTSTTIVTGIKMDVGWKARFGFFDIVVVEGQMLVIGVGEAVAFGGVGKIFSS
jgi:hypothetical protein